MENHTKETSSDVDADKHKSSCLWSRRIKPLSAKRLSPLTQTLRQPSRPTARLIKTSFGRERTISDRDKTLLKYGVRIRDLAVTKEREHYTRYLPKMCSRSDPHHIPRIPALVIITLVLIAPLADSCFSMALTISSPSTASTTRRLESLDEHRLS